MGYLDTNEFRTQIDLYLDNALPTKDQEELLRHIDSDPHAQRILRDEQSFRTFIRTNYKKTPAGPSLMDNIKSSLDI